MTEKLFSVFLLLFCFFFGPPHLALNPPFCFCFLLLFFFFLSFLCFSLKDVFSPRKGHFLFIFECLPFFLLSLFWLPPFQFLFLCLSLLLVFLSSFLSFLFAFFWFLVFVSFFPFLSSLLLFHASNNIKTFNYKVLFHQSFLFLGVSCLGIPFSYLCFSCFKLCFLFNINVFGFKTNKLKTHIFGQQGGCSKCSLWACVLQNVKVIVFWGPFWTNFGWCSEATINFVFQLHVLKAKNGKMTTFTRRHYLIQDRGIIWSKLVSQKKGNLDQIMPIKICAHTFFFKRNPPKPLFL